ncbi:hypothetical protein G7Y89_g14461 [Cudoniella acicularis]|uniref:Ribosomal protein S16 n=1 Tax=Cudoniella acicularis TaxID=354080 RepID=A0A8H4VTG6_9HELO|nr:hypothetical protein G7Y89_g14461 [Cudoniella acicularis]
MVVKIRSRASAAEKLLSITLSLRKLGIYPSLPIPFPNLISISQSTDPSSFPVSFNSLPSYSSASITNQPGKNRTARNSKPIEVLGTYDPIPKAPIDGEGKPFKDIRLDTARAKYWLGVGAQPSDPAWRLLSMAGLLVPKYRPNAGTDTASKQTS